MPSNKTILFSIMISTLGGFALMVLMIFYMFGYRNFLTIISPIFPLIAYIINYKYFGEHFWLSFAVSLISISFFVGGLLLALYWVSQVI